MEINTLLEAKEYIAALERENRELKLEIERLSSTQRIGRRKHNVQWQYTLEQVLELRAKGASVKEISEQLKLCEKTVREYLHYAKDLGTYGPVPAKDSL